MDKQGKDPGGSDVSPPWLAAKWGAVRTKLSGGWKLGRYFGCGKHQVKLRWRDGIVGLWESLTGQATELGEQVALATGAVW